MPKPIPPTANSAISTLANPSCRLQHPLELETPESVQVDRLFMEAGTPAQVRARIQEKLRPSALIANTRFAHYLLFILKLHHDETKSSRCVRGNHAGIHRPVLGLRRYELYTASVPRNDSLPELSRLPRLSSALSDHRRCCCSNRDSSLGHDSRCCSPARRRTSNLRSACLWATDLRTTNLRAASRLWPTYSRNHFGRIPTRVRSADVR